jgi:hypothetical protein
LCKQIIVAKMKNRQEKEKRDGWKEKEDSMKNNRE